MSWKHTKRACRNETTKLLQHMTKEERLHSLLMVLRRIHQRKERRQRK